MTVLASYWSSLKDADLDCQLQCLYSTHKEKPVLRFFLRSRLVSGLSEELLIFYKYWLTFPESKNVKLILKLVAVNIIEDQYFPKQIHWFILGTRKPLSQRWLLQAVWPLICIHCVCVCVVVCVCSGGLTGCCCGRSSPWEARRTQESQWRNSLSCWRRDIGWTNLQSAPMNCRCLYEL